MNKDFIEELRLRLKAPWIALERVAKGQSLPKVFVKAALDELKKVIEAVSKLENQKKGQKR